MSSGRGRGYTGKHREPRPGFPDDGEHPIRLPDPRPPEPKPLPDMAREERPEEKDPPKLEYHISSDDEAALKELLTVDEQYTPLLVLLEQFAPGEDGIQFNRKLRHFESTVTSMCPDEARLQRAFLSFRAAALLRASTARRLAAVGACFTRQQRQQPLRAALLNVVMQGTFAKLDALERANPAFLINAANLMGDYFAEARLCNGNKVHILAAPLLQYMRALLACDDIRAHRSLATQLMQNGRELLSVLATELDDLSISIRLRLLTPPSVNIIWLLLSADLCLNKFLPLPTTLQQFYAAHLELSTDDSYSEVNYGSWKNSPEKGSTSSELENVGLNVSQLNLSHDEDGKPKLRPILGAGAGLLRQEQALTAGQDTFDAWTSKNEFAKQEYTVKNDFVKEYNKSSLSKRYDLNSWRQNEEEKEEDPVFNPSVLPPNIPYTVPDYPPPNIQPNRFKNYDNLPNYLQQGDGPYIQSGYNNSNYNQQGEFVPNSKFENDEKTFTEQKTNEFAQGDFNQRQTHEDSNLFTQSESDFKQFPERPGPEKVNNEVQKSSRRPVENWRREKSDVKEDANRNRPKNWTRHSKESLYDEEEPEQNGDKFKPRVSRELRPGNRNSRRNSSESSNPGTGMSRTPPRRHVTEVPRSNKYWDHDDRCDKDYNS